MNLEVQIKKKLDSFLLEVDFQTSSGVLGILGASGCGKSMTLKAIAGLMTPDEGRIVLNNRVLFDSEKRINLPPQKRHTGYLFQNYALFPNMTVEQNIMAGVKEKKKIKNEKAQEIITLLQLSGLEKQYPEQLSGGQQQRVALARLLAFDPEVLLLDEPFSALDSYLKEQLQLKLRELLRYYGKTVLFVSHDRNEIYRLANTTMTMKAGKILQKGDTKELFEYPKDPVTARLIGCRNLSKAKLLDKTHMEAKEWGIVFTLEETWNRTPINLGIHGHGLHLKRELEEKEKKENCFRVQIVEVMEEPYEYHVLVQAISKLTEGANLTVNVSNHSNIWCTLKKKPATHPDFYIGEECWLIVSTDRLLFF